MKIVDLKKRLRPNRRSETVSIATPDDILPIWIAYARILDSQVLKR